MLQPQSRQPPRADTPPPQAPGGGVQVARVAPGGCAEEHGELQVADVLVECNGVQLTAALPDEAARVFREAHDGELALRIRRRQKRVPRG